MGMDTFIFENIVFPKIWLETFQTYWAIHLPNIGCKLLIWSPLKYTGFAVHYGKRVIRFVFFFCEEGGYKN